MMNIEYVKIQITVKNIKKIKKIGSFAKVINYLVDKLNNEDIIRIKRDLNEY